MSQKSAPAHMGKLISISKKTFMRDLAFLTKNMKSYTAVILQLVCRQNFSRLDLEETLILVLLLQGILPVTAEVIM